MKLKFCRNESRWPDC